MAAYSAPVVLSTGGSQAYASVADMSEAAILERIRPVGRVRLEGEAEVAAAKPAPLVPDTPAAPAQKVAAAAPAPAAASGGGGGGKGESVYKTFCIACHKDAVAGAPKFGDNEQWAPRVAKGMDAMMQSVIKGLNSMPPKGTCMTCSEADLKATVEYILSKSS